MNDCLLVFGRFIHHTEMFVSILYHQDVEAKKGSPTPDSGTNTYANKYVHFPVFKNKISYILQFFFHFLL